VGPAKPGDLSPNGDEFGHRIGTRCLVNEGRHKVNLRAILRRSSDEIVDSGQKVVRQLMFKLKPVFDGSRSIHQDGPAVALVQLLVIGDECVSIREGAISRRLHLLDEEHVPLRVGRMKMNVGDIQSAHRDATERVIRIVGHDAVGWAGEDILVTDHERNEFTEIAPL
jgi:hypothetical protein